MYKIVARFSKKKGAVFGVICEQSVHFFFFFLRSDITQRGLGGEGGKRERGVLCFFFSHFLLSFSVISELENVDENFSPRLGPPLVPRYTLTRGLCISSQFFFICFLLLPPRDTTTLSCPLFPSTKNKTL